MNKKIQKKLNKEQIHAEVKQFNKQVRANFRRELVESIKHENHVVRKDGKAYIDVDLTKVDSPFSVYSYDRRINQEIYDYIDNEVYFLRASIPVVINFDDGGKFDDETKEKIRKVVRRHYILRYEDCKLEYRKSTLAGVFFGFVGIIFLLTYILLTVSNIIDSIFYEIIVIFSWAFIWEAVNRFAFTGHDYRVDMLNNCQLALSEVRFGKPVSNKN